MVGSRAVKGSAALRDCGWLGCAPSPDLLSACAVLCPSCLSKPGPHEGDPSQFVFLGPCVLPPQTLSVPVTPAVIFALLFARLFPVAKDISKGGKAMVSDPKMP